MDKTDRESNFDDAYISGGKNPAKPPRVERRSSEHDIGLNKNAILVILAFFLTLMFLAKVLS